MKHSKLFQSALSRKFILLFVFVYVAQLLVGALVIIGVSRRQAKAVLSNISNQAKEDISYNNGTWDMSRYETDPEFPGNYRLYIITKDGYVIDRWRPIAGYLDTSDLKQLGTHPEPRSVKTVTNQNWRLLSKPIHGDDKNIGVVVVGQLISSGTPAELSDNTLKTSAQALSDNIQVTGNSIDVSNINVRDVPYNVSFQIVDQYNKLLVKSNTANSVDRLPNFIDPSYIVDNLRQPSFKRITDSNNKESFLVHSSPITDNNGNAVGTIIVGRSVSYVIELVRNYLIISALVLFLLLFIVSSFVNSWLEASGSKQHTKPTITLPNIRYIMFNKKGHFIQINEHKIQLAFATNQYYLTQTLFSAPKKKWELDELLEKMGKTYTNESWRKLYDAMAAINKKANNLIQPKLIVTSNKTFCINPQLIEKIQK